MTEQEAMARAVVLACRPFTGTTDLDDILEIIGPLFTEIAAAELYIRSGSHASKAAYTAAKKAREEHFAALEGKS